MTKTLKLTLLLLFILQLLVSQGFELAHDESYYWLFSKHLDWGYFDHPPMMALVIKLFSFLPHSEFSVRLGFILLQFGTLALIFRLLPKSSWFWSTLLFFAFPLASFCGLLALPDMPLLFMTALYCVGLREYLRKPSAYSVLGLGVIIPMLLYAKYHGILVIFFTLVAIPRLLLRKDFYVIALISILLFLPHVWWQYQHDFATLRYHFLERPSSAFSLKRIFDYLLTQTILAGLLIGPVVWWKTAKFKTSDDFGRAMKMISLGVVIFFLISTVSKKFEANWTIFLTPCLIYLVSLTNFWSSLWVKRLTFVSFGIVVLARLVLVLPQSLVPIKRLGEFHGWRAWSQEIVAACGQRPIIANSYQVASKLSFYLDREIGSMNIGSRKNQFNYWRFDKAITERDVCYLTDKAEFSGVEMKTPDGKLVKIVTNKLLHELQYSSQL